MKMPHEKVILIMAGGTGGHVFPALAVASVLRANRFHVVWLGTRAGIEAKLVPAAGIDIEWLPVSGLRGKGVLAVLFAPFRLLRAGVAAFRVFRRVQPAAVLGMGGFASGPGGVIAWLTGHPLIVHEQNAIAGLTNRLLARVARRALVAFPGALSNVANEEVAGNPVREELAQLESPEHRFAQRSGKLRVLVLGGSLGARALNEALPHALRESGLEVTVLHQCGRGDCAAVKQQYDAGNIDAKVEPFIDDMAAAYAWADIAICRAGAMTVFELAAVGLGAVLVPYPHAVDDHQTANADYLVRAQAAVLMQEKEMSTEKLAATICQVGTRDRLLVMARNARAQARPGATRHVASVCMTLAGGAA